VCQSGVGKTDYEKKEKSVNTANERRCDRTKPSIIECGDEDESEKDRWGKGVHSRRKEKRTRDRQRK